MNTLYSSYFPLFILFHFIYFLLHYTLRLSLYSTLFCKHKHMLILVLENYDKLTKELISNQISDAKIPLVNFLLWNGPKKSKRKIILGIVI
jgi:hypothetical protein